MLISEYKWRVLQTQFYLIFPHSKHGWMSVILSEGNLIMKIVKSSDWHEMSLLFVTQLRWILTDLEWAPLPSPQFTRERSEDNPIPPGAWDSRWPRHSRGGAGEIYYHHPPLSSPLSSSSAQISSSNNNSVCISIHHSKTHQTSPAPRLVLFPAKLS